MVVAVHDNEKAGRVGRAVAVLKKLRQQVEPAGSAEGRVQSPEAPALPAGPSSGVKGIKYKLAELRVALENERQVSQVGYGFKITAVTQLNAGLQLDLELSRDAGPGTSLDENLEGATAWWVEGDSAARGDVYVVDGDKGRVLVRFITGAPPTVGKAIKLYPPDFLTPLIELLELREIKDGIRELSRRDSSLFSPAPLAADFADLRVRQLEVVGGAGAALTLVNGPPGTGKTYTLGATIANFLIQQPGKRVLLLGPTNAAVDGLLLSADRWLAWLGRRDLAATMKRVGSRFNSQRYVDAPHLLPQSVAEAAVRLRILELEEPKKDDLDTYAHWRRAIDAARAELRADLLQTVATSRVIAMTTTAAAQAYGDLSVFDWSITLFDEASQITLPAALALATLGRCALYAGDPNQLAAVVQSADKRTQLLLGRTAFDTFRKRARSVFLDEQSRMAPPICDAVSSTFYDGRLVVCRKARDDPAWLREREHVFIDGFELPSLAVVQGIEPSKWSKAYGGAIRYWSAEAVAMLIDHLAGSYVEGADILVLTPFRAQRSLIRRMLRRGHAQVDVTTVHRAQGGERRIVIFDPVDGASPFLSGLGGRRLINVASSRAMAHLVLMSVQADLANPFLCKLVSQAPRLPFDARGQRFRFL